MNAIMDRIKDVASFVVVLVYPMLTIVRNVQFKRKIEMVAQRSLTLEAQKQIYSTRERSMDLKDGSPVSVSKIHSSKTSFNRPGFFWCYIFWAVALLSFVALQLSHQMHRNESGIVYK